MTELEQELTDELGKPAGQYAQEQKRLAGQVKSFVEGFVKLTEPRQDSPENEWGFAIAQQAHVIVFPIGKSPGAEESMMVRFQMMTTDSEQVLNGAVD